MSKTARNRGCENEGWEERRFRAGSLAALAGVAALSAIADRPAAAPCEYEVTVLDYPIDCAIASVTTVGTAISNDGAVVGFWKCPIWTHHEAFVWTPEGGFTTLQRPPGVYSVVATDINDEGLVCGEMILDGGASSTSSTASSPTTRRSRTAERSSPTARRAGPG